MVARVGDVSSTSHSPVHARGPHGEETLHYRYMLAQRSRCRASRVLSVLTAELDERSCPNR